ncbi:hypothetical protein SDC9_131784 [bioreactor metagenome]|uniref:Uncharacterized protein n=1 Tax=bioreactor metagenome TaxID=1076179 RepID=A0A645D642_9ZZZZ
MDLAYFTTAAAGGAFGHSGTGLSTLAATGGTNFVTGDLNLFFDAKNGLFKGQTHRIAQVSATARSVLALAAVTRSEAEEFAKDVREIHAGPIRHTPGTVQPIFTVLVVHTALIVI